MTTPMTSRERIFRTYQHRETDRIPIADWAWDGTVRRWHAEGMPANLDWRDYFGLDICDTLHVDVSPRYERRVLEETDQYTILVTDCGVTYKDWKEEDSTPEFLDFTVTDAEKWLDAKARMTPDPSRVNWDAIKTSYPQWRAAGHWIQAYLWFGFDVTHSWLTGIEPLLEAFIEEPDWAKDIFGTYLDMNLAHFDMLWDAGYTFDGILWPDDMGYKGTSFFSPSLYREILQPFHKKAVDWAHGKGIYAELHSCGNIMGLLPDVVATGIDALNPLEVKAGMDGAYIKKTYGDHLVLHGGVNAVLWDDHEAILAEIEAKVPVLAANGGYIFASDHSIPNTVSLQEFKDIVAKVHSFTP